MSRPRPEPKDPRLLVANLDAEIELARAATPGPHPPLSAAAARRAGVAGTYMALLARPGDRLWLPSRAAGEQGCAAAAERGLAIETGPLEQVAPAATLCAWAETDAIAELRRAGSAASGAEPTDDEIAEAASGRDWRAALWHLRPDAPTAARVNRRGFAFALALARGWALPGARLVHGLDQLKGHLADGGADAGIERAWVVKAPLSAAGRERVRSRGRELGRADEAGIERLFRRFGELLFEPWVDRLRDVGCAGLVHPGGVRLFPPHALDNDQRGVFRAAIIDDDAEDTVVEIRGAAAAEAGVTPGLAAGDLGRRLAEAAGAAGAALAAADYRGPFSVDTYTWRDPSGAVHLQPMSEINARLSFGLLARMAAEDAGRPRGRFELRP